MKTRKLTAYELKELLHRLNKLDSFNDEDNIDDEVLERYAEYVHNYLYQYNDEALKV